MKLRIPPLALVLIVAALMWLASSASPALDYPFPARLPVAIGLALLGAAVCLSGVLSFRRAGTTVNPMKPGSASSLVVAGIYKFTRNPMYLGLLVALLGWAVFLANALAWAAIPLFVLYMNRFQIVPEERALASLFGQEYLVYNARVPRWI